MKIEAKDYGYPVWVVEEVFKTGLEETFDWYAKNHKFFNLFSRKNFFKRLGLTK